MSYEMYSNTHFYLKLWKFDEKAYKNKIKKESKGKEFELEVDDKVQLARIELFTDPETMFDPEISKKPVFAPDHSTRRVLRPNVLHQSAYSGDSLIKNWGPGVLKNYIQTLTSYFENEEEVSLYSDFEKDELRKLQNSTLYVPDYVLNKFNVFTAEENNKHEDLFEDYEYDYEIVSIEELNQRILTEKPFYYLLYVRSSTDKFVSIVNSETGELIYSDYTPISYNLKSKDLKKISKEIE